MKLVRSKRKTTVIAVAAAIALIAGGTNFAYGHEGHAHHSDYSGHWSEQLIISAIREGLVQGYENGLYAPDLAITRAELAVLLARTLPSGGSAIAEIGPLKDVDNGSWYAEAVRRTVSAGLLTADEEGFFRPGALVTRLDGAIVLGRLQGWSEQGEPWPENILDRQAAPAEGGGSWLAQAAAEGYITASSEGYILPYRPWTRSESLYALLKTKGIAPEGIRPAVFAAVQSLEGVIRDAGTGFALAAVRSSQGTVTESVYSLSSGKSLAGTKAAVGTDGLAVKVAGVGGLVPALDRLILNSISLQAESATPDKLEGILLEGHHSTTASPAEHKKLCLLMPDCAASGFGVSVLQDDGSYKFYKFDEAGHKLAVVLLDSIAAPDHVGIRVEGHIAGDLIHVARLSQVYGHQEAVNEAPASPSAEEHPHDTAGEHGQPAGEGAHGHDAGEHHHTAE